MSRMLYVYTAITSVPYVIMSLSTNNPRARENPPKLQADIRRISDERGGGRPTRLVSLISGVTGSFGGSVCVYIYICSDLINEVLVAVSCLTILRPIIFAALITICSCRAEV